MKIEQYHYAERTITVGTSLVYFLATQQKLFLASSSFGLTNKVENQINGSNSKDNGSIGFTHWLEWLTWVLHIGEY